MRANFILVLAFALCCAGCSVTAPLQGQTEDGKITFTGYATGYMDYSGELEAIRSDGIACSGTWVMQTLSFGRGIMTCTDNLSGTYEFTTTGQRGIGQGKLGPYAFTFSFGEKYTVKKPEEGSTSGPKRNFIKEQ